MSGTDHYVDLTAAYKVGVLTLLTAGPFCIEWCVTICMHAAVANSNSALILVLCGSVSVALGACLGASLAKSWRNCPRVAAIGALLMVPFMFALWSYLASPPAGGLPAFFWQAVALGSLGCLGMGMNLTAALGYLGKAYKVTHNRDTGKVVGSFALFWVVGALLLASFALYLLASSIVWGIILAVVVTLAAIFWWLQPSKCGGNLNANVDHHGILVLLKCFLFLLAPLTACAAFGCFATFVVAGSSPMVQCISDWVRVFAALGAVVFFGWGFDGCRTAALKTWIVIAVFTVVLMVWGVVSAGFYLWPVVTSLCFLLKDGGNLFFLSHMLYHSDNSAIGTAAVYLVYLSVGELVSFTLLAYFATSATIQFFFVAVLLVVTVGIVLTGSLPQADQRYTKLTQGPAYHQP